MLVIDRRMNDDVVATGIGYLVRLFICAHAIAAVELPTRQCLEDLLDRVALCLRAILVAFL